MDYVYDIVLNFQPKYYEFYEWEPSDRIINIKKLPIYKVTNQDYLNIKNNDVTIKRNTIPKLNKMFLITSGLEIMGILIDDNGKVLKKSSLIFEENDDILKDKDEIKLIKIKYTINKKLASNYQSRNKLAKISYINKYLNSLDKQKDKYFFKYLYFDIFKVDESDINKIYDDLNKLLVNNPTDFYDQLKKIDFELKRKNFSNK